MNIEERIRVFFIREGYKLLESSVLNKLLWQPDLLLSKDNHIYPVLIKSNNTILPTFLNRIASIPSNKIVPIIIFSQKPAATVEKNILSLGVGVGFHSNGKITYLNIRKKLPKREVLKKIKINKLSIIDIFVSSKQHISEREFARNIIEKLRQIHSYPFNLPHLIEYDKFQLSKLYEHIDEVMKNCEWIVIILEENPSETVKYEINKAIEEFDHDNIFMFVKSTKDCKEVWKKELGRIKNLESKSIKYMPYSNLIDLEVSLSKAINCRIAEICKKKKIKIFV